MCSLKAFFTVASALGFLAAAPIRAETEDSTLQLPDTLIRLHMEDARFALPRESFEHWIRRSAHVVSHYYGKFPVAQMYIALIPVSGKGVKNGKAFAIDDATINVRVGTGADHQDLLDDWIMVHEMIHFALPRVPRRHHWIEEGLAVYVESVARSNAGDLAPKFVWAGFLKGMPHGLPANGDSGLDNTPTWGRTYWGGALFCLLADIEIRKRTDNRKSLRDGLQAIVHQGFSMLDEKPVEELFAIADAGTGTAVLTELYEHHRDTAHDVDLDGLWQSLGVQAAGTAVEFDTSAPLRHISESITARDPGF
ncbi:MAG: hypothetical protein OET44_12920 [Gammaproteobacteria bacterium]|nr:hypothetical protein [Gammaproteobacteria bacterium]